MHSHSKVPDRMIKFLQPISLAGSNSAFSAPLSDQKTQPQVGCKRSFNERTAFTVSEVLKKMTADKAEKDKREK